MLLTYFCSDLFYWGWGGVPAYSSEQQLEITSCVNPVFNFWGAFVSPKTVKNNIAGMINNLESLLRSKSQLEEVTFLSFQAIKS